MPVFGKTFLQGLPLQRPIFQHFAVEGGKIGGRAHGFRRECETQSGKELCGERGLLHQFPHGQSHQEMVGSIFGQRASQLNGIFFTLPI